MHSKSQVGVTLIEMACVLAVLSILGGIAGPSMYKWRQRAERLFREWTALRPLSARWPQLGDQRDFPDLQ